MADNLNVIKCPACQKEMKKIFIPEEGINVDICTDGCGGIYFDNREFNKFDEEHEDITAIIEGLGDKKFIKVDESLPRSCPVCGAKMVKNYSSAKKEVQVDDCYKCGGKFLDRGELIKIREEYKTEEERTADVVNMVMETVGPELEKLKNDHEKALKNRSPLRKAFDEFIWY